ncbi:MAG: hypothetical protein E7474_06590 [Ruminococcaceae bacterium]|nr:hypothetical protein [Oscillospiraceae bacterium]
MGDTSIIARRLSDKYVQYGWSGNGGYYECVGACLLEDYQTPEMVEYLFALGQLHQLNKPYSELTTKFFKNEPTGEPHWVDPSERWIFSKIMFIDYGYFYDSDGKWYYVIPGPFRIKMPLELIGNNLDNKGYEFSYRHTVQEQLLKHIFEDVYPNDEAFRKALAEAEYTEQKIRETYEELAQSEHPIYDLFESHKSIFEYFDDWVLCRTDAEYTKITEFVMKPHTETHIETINW